jgi:hypothetical protein
VRYESLRIEQAAMPIACSPAPALERAEVRGAQHLGERGELQATARQRELGSLVADPSAASPNSRSWSSVGWPFSNATP